MPLFLTGKNPALIIRDSIGVASGGELVVTRTASRVNFEVLTWGCAHWRAYRLLEHKSDTNMGNVTKKKRICAGHRSSATRMLTQVEESLATSPPNVVRLSQLKFSLQEKLETLKLQDREIVDLTEESHLADEIEQADGY